MKFLKRFLKGILILLVSCIVVLYILDYEYILKGVRVVYMTGHTTAFIDDKEYFDNRVIEKGNDPYVIPNHPQYNEVASTPRLNEINEELGTVAFMIIKNDSVWYENYVEGYGTSSKTNSFSMAKSVITALLGKAIMEGYIKSLDQPVGDFIPKFSEGLAAKMTVGDLSSMASGLNWDESYKSPFSITAKAYYDTDLRDVMLDLEVVSQPGERFKYLSGNTQLLGMVIEKATGKTLTKYLSESFWKPLGMQENALWQLDSEDSGMEKAYCCIASNARDFAKFGLLFKNMGEYDGKQILPEDFIRKATQPRFPEDDMYGYGFWLSDHMGKDIFAMRGILGQYVICIPEDDLIIVRLGHQRGQFVPGESFTEDFFIYIEEAYKMLADAS
ncbi:serine hydrolase domain-containing protein [Aquimarina brevivitae]|uniref:CubicO group peptidase (Beta-lactamase class C family) n=1 Tax=Aquimarina brevivitae TaxID=323412 RepID=A0A4Q7PJP8_9FLAO|nr:serine hydrolase domain-containing protein [Aquimarina brevivitae]RZS99132.1 CubicO group peptidase (beta-lactamase class C family) [Aquimarina brevivitae]